MCVMGYIHIYVIITKCNLLFVRVFKSRPRLSIQRRVNEILVNKEKILKVYEIINNSAISDRIEAN